MLGLVLLLSLSAPFEDVHQRFKLELPEPWRFAPMPGDVDGAAFRRDYDGMPVNMHVRVLQAPGASVESWMHELAVLQEKEPGFELLAEGPVALSGLLGKKRRVVFHLQGDRRLTKMSEDRVAMYRNTLYVVHMETLAEAFVGLDRELDALASSITLPVQLEVKANGRIESPVVGRWSMVNDPAIILDLKSDGTFRLAGTQGTYLVDATNVVTRALGAAEESFEWKLSGDELELRAIGWVDAVRYKRVIDKKPGKKGKK